MRNSRWICWYLCQSIPTIIAFPIESLKTTGNTGNYWSSQWENHWPSYVFGTLGFVVVALTLAGCLCCQRQRRPKGFQDDAGTGKEFKDGSTAGTETTIERVASSSLELEVPRILTSSREKIQFDEISYNNVETRSTIKPPSSSLYNDKDDDKNLSGDRGCNEWYEGENFPREKLKYLREIGRGWFGKVVEGTTMIEDERKRNLGEKKNRGVVVRILTEGATSREKSWFLGESTPYLKLRHPNILELLGFCLETDPYLLLFESCPVGDLKQFLISNRENGEALRTENLPTRMALNIADALEHMHENGFAHTDLSARNCLVANDLTAKLGDYGIGVEKYPGDYYILGDRALPIRWSAPESLECTETTIETRAITPRANIWSYGILLWEIANWAERPYDNLGDEQVIEMIFSTNDKNSIKFLKSLMVKRELPENFQDAIETTWNFLPEERSSLARLKEILCGKRIEDFEKRWENLKPNGSNSIDKSASLQDLRGSMDSELWQANSPTDKNSLRANFRLGPQEPVMSLMEDSFQPGSGSETEEESWRGRVERGAYTDKVKQKSKSVADLMILVHIDSDSDLESSLGPSNIDKTFKKRLPPSGSDGDLRSAVIADEFDEALRKLRDPTISNIAGGKISRNIVDDTTADEDVTENVAKIDENVIISENIEKPKLLTLTNQGQTPILRLSLGNPTREPGNDEIRKGEENSTNVSQEDKIIDKESKFRSENLRNEEHVLRLVSKGNPDLPLLRYFPERTSTPISQTETPSLDSFLVLENRESSTRIPEVNGTLDVKLWNDALAHELEKKNPAYVEDSIIFGESLDLKMNYFEDSPSAKMGCSSAPETPHRDYSASKMKKLDGRGRIVKNGNYFANEVDATMDGSSSAPATPFNGKYNVSDHEEDSSTCEDLEERMIVKDSAPDTPQSRGNYSVGNGDEDSSSTGEELESGMMKRSSHEGDDEEDRKHLSTPDDERSSDSGFRDKESCEEEESPIPGSQVTNIILGGKKSSVSGGNSSPLSASAEEEQMRILFELDTILDAEYYGNFRDSEKSDETEASLENVKIRFEDSDEIVDKIRSISESHESTESTEILKTVRANSCEANFLDNFFDKQEDTNAETKYEFPNDEQSTDLLESTEADSVSEFFKIEDNRSSSKKDDFFLADSSYESPIKTDRNLSNDSSIELARLNLDSSGSRETKNETTDLSPETRSENLKNESNSDVSPMKTDRNSSTELSLDLRLETSDSTSSSGKSDKKNTSPDDIPETSEKTESSCPKNETPEDEKKEEKLSSSPDIELSEKNLINEVFLENCQPEETSKLSKTPEISITSVEPETTLVNVPEASECSLKKEVSENVEEKESSSSLVDKKDETSLILENREETENSDTDRQRDTLNSEGEQWSSRENLEETNENEEEEDSSTMSLRSDNSYVSFGLDEEFVTAIRNELREKLPRAQMSVVEALDPDDEKETASINAETIAKSWAEEDEIDENSERSNVDISIRYNIYGTPLSPIMEERESTGTSESQVSKADSGDASIASRVSALSEDVLVVDTRTNRAIIVQGGGNGAGNAETSNSQQDDDRDTTHGDISDEENLEYPQSNLNRGLESKRILMGSGGAPLPSPEEESKWQQQFPLPLQMQDDLMSTSFGTDRDWDSQDDEEGEDDGDEGEDDEEENSSSSGEFVWKRYEESHGDLENVATRSPPSKPKSQETDGDLDQDEEEGDEEDELEEEEEFTPSAWDATLAPHRSALRSPEKNPKSGDQKKSVWFKKQRYHCVYEYPKETLIVEGQGQAATTWEPTSYADWEEMMDEPRLDMYPIEYDESNRAGDEEFYVSSSNRPFQFQSGEGKYVSQFFPGASTTLLQHENQHQMSSSSSSSREADELQSSHDEVDRAENSTTIVQSSQTNGNSRGTETLDNQQQTQLGELRHTRDRLKLNLLSTSGSTRTDEETENRCRDRDTTCERMEESNKKIEEPKEIKKESIVKDETIKLESLTKSERLSDDKLLDKEEIADTREKFQPKIDKIGESSSLGIFDNLAVNDASKIESKERIEEAKEIFLIDDRELKMEKNKIVEEVKILQEEKGTFPEVGSTVEVVKNFGDQKEEFARSRENKDAKCGNVLEIPKLEIDESLSINDDRTNAEIVVESSTNNSSKSEENSEKAKSLEKVESSSES